MTTTYSRTEWATLALQDAIVDGEETPSAALLAWATQVGRSIYEGLVAQGVRMPAASDSVLPIEYLQPFANLVALDLNAKVGLISKGDALQAMALQTAAIRRLNVPNPSAAPTPVEYF